MAGIVPARGDWEYRTFTISSTATFFKGDALRLNGVRELAVYNSVSSQVHGIAMHDSSASLPAGKCVVAIPAPNCTAYIDVPTGLTASQLSLGQSLGLYKSGATNTSYLTTLMGSAYSTVGVIAGPIDSTLSRIEIAFLVNGGLYSATTSVFLS